VQLTRGFFGAAVEHRGSPTKFLRAVDGCGIFWRLVRDVLLDPCVASLLRNWIRSMAPRTVNGVVCFLVRLFGGL